VKVACGAVLALAVAATVAAAQAPVPTVAVSASASAVTVGGEVPAGPVRMEFTKSGGGPPISAYVATLRAGVTPEQLQQTLSQDADAALGLVFLEAAASLPTAGATRAVTFDVRPNVVYAIVAIPEQENAPQIGFTTFTSGAAPSGATAPAADATVRMVDYGFRGAGTLPRGGTVRVVNAGSAFHFAFAVRIRPGVGNRQVARTLRRGSDRAFARAFQFNRSIELQGTISPGTTNTNEVTFPQGGRYALVCFFGGHNRLGMYRVVRVR
jgi:hypothetical protein